MLSKIKNNQTLKTLLNTRNLGLYLLLVITLSVTWSSIKTIQKNYEIEKEISALTQEVAILEQEVINQDLKNEYYKTDAFLELAARKYFGRAAPGEQFISIPTEIADKYTHPEATVATVEQEVLKPKSQLIQNWQNWIDFFLNRD